MPTTRGFKSLGIAALSADTIIPAQLVPGTSYRDDALTQSENEEGQKANTNLESPNRNQQQFIITSFTDTIDRHGLVGWSDLVDYVVPAMVWADDGVFYQALLSSGPNNGGAVDPATEVTSTFWIPFDLDFTFVNGDTGYFRNNETGRTEQWMDPDVNFNSFTTFSGSFNFPMPFIGVPNTYSINVYDVNSVLSRKPMVWATTRSPTQLGAAWSQVNGGGGTLAGKLMIRALGVT